MEHQLHAATSGRRPTSNSGSANGTSVSGSGRPSLGKSLSGCSLGAGSGQVDGNSTSVYHQTSSQQQHHQAFEGTSGNSHCDGGSGEHHFYHQHNPHSSASQNPHSQQHRSCYPPQGSQMVQPQYHQKQHNHQQQQPPSKPSPQLIGQTLYMNPQNPSGQSRNSVFHEVPAIAVMCQILETRWAAPSAGPLPLSSNGPETTVTEESTVVARFHPNPAAGKNGGAASSRSSSVSQGPAGSRHSGGVASPVPSAPVPRPENMDQPFSLFAFHTMFRVKGEQVGPEVPIDWTDFGCVYHCTTQSQISLEAYIERIVKYFKCAPQCFPIALALLDRFVHNTRVAVDSRNVLRLFLCAILTAAKSREEKYMTTSYYAHIGGVTPFELRSLEIHFLFSLKWELHVPEQRYNDIAAGIALSAVIPRGLNSLRDVRPPPTTTGGLRSPPQAYMMGGGSAASVTSAAISDASSLRPRSNSGGSAGAYHPTGHAVFCSPQTSRHFDGGSDTGSAMMQGRQSNSSPYCVGNTPQAPQHQPYHYSSNSHYHQQQQQQYHYHQHNPHGSTQSSAGSGQNMRSSNHQEGGASNNSSGGGFGLSGSTGRHMTTGSQSSAQGQP